MKKAGRGFANTREHAAGKGLRPLNRERTWKKFRFRKNVGIAGVYVKSGGE